MSLMVLASLPSPHLTPNHQHNLPVSHTTTPSPSPGGGTQLLTGVCEHATGMPPTWPLVTQSSGTPRNRSRTLPGVITKAPARKYVPLLSASSLTTAVLTLQGVQASFIIFSRLNP